MIAIIYIVLNISIHAFRVEGDPIFDDDYKIPLEFQSTPSVWKATNRVKFLSIFNNNFNPRLPCGRRLILLFRQTLQAIYFNPRLPCGRRQFFIIFFDETIKNFNPRLPCGRRHAIVKIDAANYDISIHPFRVEGDEVI